MKQSNKKFNEAKRLPNDNWKTSLCDINLELKSKLWGFNNEIILCCCNDYNSAFKEYFYKIIKDWNKHYLAGTKQVYKTHIDKAIFTEYNPNGNAKVLEIDHNLKETKKILKGTGAFASEEVIALIKEATIIVTNPPFSKFREFVELLIKYNKNFFIIGPKNACAYRWYFRLWKEYKINYGATWNDDFIFENEQGEKVKFRNIAWHSNIRIGKEMLYSNKKFNKKNYPLLENYKNCIFVDKIKNIPIGYKGLMAVPPSFGYRLNRFQYELVDLIEPVINEKRGYTKIIIKRTKAEFLHKPYHKIEWDKNE